jgi:hypothetical protein
MLPSRFVLPVCLGLALSASSAQAAPCSSLPNPIILAGASAWTFLLQGMATILAGQPTPVTLVLQNKIGSCGAVRSVTEDVTPQGACAPGACTTGTAIYWGANGLPQSCDLDAAGTHVDVGVSDLFIETCLGSAPPADTKSFYSPVLPMNIIVNKASTQKAMTAEEGYFVWGFGNRGQANPWVNESFLFIRNVNSGTQNIISLSVGIPPAKMKGIDRGSATGVIDAVAGAADAEAAIGIASAEYYDQNRDKVKAGLSRLSPAPWLLRRLYRHGVRQAQRARRPLPTVGLRPHDRQGRRRGRPGQAAGEAAGRLGAGPSNHSPVRYHRASDARLHGARVRDERAAHPRPRRPVVVSAGAALRLLLRKDGHRKHRLYHLHERLDVRRWQVPARLLRSEMTETRKALNMTLKKNLAAAAIMCSLGGLSCDDPGPANQDLGPKADMSFSLDCYENPKSHVEIINACTNAERVTKNPTLPLLKSDGSLPPLP